MLFLALGSLDPKIHAKNLSIFSLAQPLLKILVQSPPRHYFKQRYAGSSQALEKLSQ